MVKEITRDIILVLIVIAGLVSFFYVPEGTESGMKFLQTIMGSIVGWYTGIKTVPVMSAMKK